MRVILLGGPGAGNTGIVKAIDYLTASNRLNFGDTVPELEGTSSTLLSLTHIPTDFASWIGIDLKHFHATQLIPLITVENTSSLISVNYLLVLWVDQQHRRLILFKQDVILLDSLLQLLLK